MQLSKIISHSILLSLAFSNFALAETVPLTCPSPKDIQQTTTQDNKTLSLHIKCIDDNCYAEQVNRFGTDFHWHFYIHPTADSAKQNISLNSQMLEVINSLVSTSSPIEEQPYAFVCRYNNSLNYTTLAVYTKEVKCPSVNDLVQQKEKGKESCWLGWCSYTLQDRFDSDFNWNFSMSWSSDLLPELLLGKYSYNKAESQMANPIKLNNNLYICSYHTRDGDKAEATYASYD
jgi:hypothetical protein